MFRCDKGLRPARESHPRIGFPHLEEGSRRERPTDPATEYESGGPARDSRPRIGFSALLSPLLNLPHNPTLAAPLLPSSHPSAALLTPAPYPGYGLRKRGVIQGGFSWINHNSQSILQFALSRFIRPMYSLLNFQGLPKPYPRFFVLLIFFCKIQ